MERNVKKIKVSLKYVSYSIIFLLLIISLYPLIFNIKKHQTSQANSDIKPISKISKDKSEVKGGEEIIIEGDFVKKGPVNISNLSINKAGYANIATHVCGIGNNQKLYCWGYNTIGPIKQDESNAVYREPVEMGKDTILEDKKIIDVANFYSHGCALDDQGKAYCWGIPVMQGWLLGHPLLKKNSGEPIAVDDSADLKDKKLVKIDATYLSACALDDQGKAYCWGANFNITGIRMEANETVKKMPVAIDDTGALKNKKLVDITVGMNSAYAIDDQGQAYIWGLGITNSYDESAKNNTKPVKLNHDNLFEGNKLKQIKVTNRQTYAIDDHNQIYVWPGCDNQMKCNQPFIKIDAASLPSDKNISLVDSFMTSKIVIKAGEELYSTMVFSDDSQVVFSKFRNNYHDFYSGQAVDYSAIKNKKILEAVDYPFYGCVLADDGKLYAMGDNYAQYGTIKEFAYKPLNAVYDDISPKVFFGSDSQNPVEAQKVEYVGDKIKVTVPAHSAGIVDIIVKSGDGQINSKVNGFTFYKKPNAPINPYFMTDKNDNATVRWQGPSGGNNEDVPNINNGYGPIIDYDIQYCSKKINDCAESDWKKLLAKVSKVENKYYQINFKSSLKEQSIRIRSVNDAGSSEFVVAGEKRLNDGINDQPSEKLPSEKLPSEKPPSEELILLPNTSKPKPR